MRKGKWYWIGYEDGEDAALAKLSEKGGWGDRIGEIVQEMAGDISYYEVGKTDGIIERQYAAYKSGFTDGFIEAVKEALKRPGWG